MTASVRPQSRALRTAKVPNCTKQLRCVAVPRQKALLRPRAAPLMPQAALLRPKAALLRPKALRPSAVLKGRSARDWLHAECGRFKGMLAVRPQAWDIQGLADRLHGAGVFGEDHCLQADVAAGPARGDRDPPLGAALRDSAAQLLGRLAGFGLPNGFAEQVQRDAEDVGVVVAELLPAADKLVLMLELMREDCCIRWHQDNYVARAIVSYNCCGTEYIHDDHVDFWELNNCGNNDHVVRDRTPVCQAGVGDILLIKGKLFPSVVNGLVHRSPDHVYHPDGAIKTRFVLKVDVRTVS